MGADRLYGLEIKTQQATYNIPSEGRKRMDLYGYCDACWPEHYTDKKQKDREIKKWHISEGTTKKNEIKILFDIKT